MVPLALSCPCFPFTQVALKGVWKMVWEKTALSEDWSTLRLYAVIGVFWQVLTTSRNGIGVP